MILSLLLVVVCICLIINNFTDTDAPDWFFWTGVIGMFFFIGNMACIVHNDND